MTTRQQNIIFTRDDFRRQNDDVFRKSLLGFRFTIGPAAVSCGLVGLVVWFGNSIHNTKNGHDFTTFRNKKREKKSNVFRLCDNVRGCFF